MTSGGPRDGRPETAPLEVLAGFGRALRAAGLVVGTDRLMAYCQGAALAAGDDLYWVGVATLVGRREDLPTYNRVFREHFLGAPGPPPVRERPRTTLLQALPLGLKDGDRPQAPELEAAVASAEEILRRKSFSGCTDEELRELARLMARLRVEAPMRLTRRRAPARDGRPDLRRTIRRSFRTGGEPVERAWRARRRKRRRIVFLLDVSGSMSAYSRALAIFAHAALRTDTRFEVFSFGTRLTRLTPALQARNPDEALRRAAEDARDWDGGTRIGDSLRSLLDRSGFARLVRGAVVVICSDGLDVGDPAVLREQMARLRRLAHRVVWLNPLKGDPAYEPLTRGMLAALPHLDALA
ncbi:MAG TPA: VWA domain-containing protein, partial [Miltoncostaeaceae bacterium]|nr:VWA domain-containing protein [Miltoncostaeaceae bacterium]